MTHAGSCPSLGQIVLPERWDFWDGTQMPRAPEALSRSLPSADPGRLQNLGAQHRLRHCRQLEPEPDPLRWSRCGVPCGQGPWGPHWGWGELAPRTRVVLGVGAP